MQKSTERGNQVRNEFLNALETHGITEDRIVYTRSKKNFRGERPEMYEEFLQRYEVPKEALILHDGGNAYKRGRTSILETLGFHNHVVYIPLMFTSTYLPTTTTCTAANPLGRKNTTILEAK